MKRALLFIWQLPQNLLGLFLVLIYGHEQMIAYKGKVFYFTPKFPGGISLGDYAILRNYPFSKSTWDAVKHEYGHSLQSLYLGPLYLLVIGLPSLAGNIIDRVFHKKWPAEEQTKWYYSLPWEKWADKLGEVKR